MQAGWRGKVGDAGGVGPWDLRGSLWAGPVMLAWGPRASLPWPPLPRHLLMGLRGERERCWGHGAVGGARPAQGSVRPRHMPLQKAPARAAGPHSWNVLWRVRRVQELRLWARSLGTPVRLGPVWGRGGRHPGKRAGVCPGLQWRPRQRFAGPLGAIPSACVRHGQTRTWQGRRRGWALQNGWAAFRRAAQRCILESLSAESKRICHWLQWAGNRGHGSVTAGLPPVRAVRPEHGLRTPGRRWPDHARRDGLGRRLHD